MSDLQQIGLFDYAGLPTVEAVEIRAAAERIKVRLKRTAEDIIEIGRDLIAVKARLGHGSFGDWLKSEFDFSSVMAQKFMQVAERFGGNTKTFSFSPSIMYLLAAPSTPESVRAEVIERAESGEKITLAEVEQLKREAAAAAELKSRNTALNLTIMELAKEGDSLKQTVAELEARPEQVVEKVIEVEKVVTVPPDDYAVLQQRAARADTLKADLADSKQKLADLKAEQARKVEDGIKQGLRQRQAELDEFERRKAELERMIESRAKRLSEFDADKNKNQIIIDAVNAFALAAGALSASLLSVEVDALHPQAQDALDRADHLLVEALEFVTKLRGLPIARLEKAA